MQNQIMQIRCFVKGKSKKTNVGRKNPFWWAKRPLQITIKTANILAKVICVRKIQN